MQGMDSVYIPRSIRFKLKKLFEHFPVVVVSGARQVGKSTLLENEFPDIHKIAFDPVVDIRCEHPIDKSNIRNYGDITQAVNSLAAQFIEYEVGGVESKIFSKELCQPYQSKLFWSSSIGRCSCKYNTYNIY